MRALIVALFSGAMVVLPATAAQAHHRRHHHHAHPHAVGTDGHGKITAPMPMVGSAAPGRHINVDPNTDGHGKIQ